MTSTSAVVQKYFPQEKVLNSYDTTLDKEVNRIFSIPFGYFKDPNLGLYQGIKIIETEKYWFIDLRYQIRPINIIFALFCISFITIFFGKRFFNAPLWFYLTAFIPSATYTLVFFIFLQKGLLVNAYKKDWVKVKKESSLLSLGITLPKYSKDTVWKLIYGNRILDFLGITISSAEVKLDYSFRLNQTEA